MTEASALESIFFDALAIKSPTEREVYLNEACAGNDQLRQSVERMLTAHAQAGSFLESPAVQRQETSAFVSISEIVGSQIGPYKLLQQIGEGGMGTVYMAEQSQPV